MSRKGKKNNPPDESAASGEYIHDIGARLIAARMARNLTLKTAAMRSGLDRSIVEKIEQNRFADIGAHVFAMDHVVRYARYLNISTIAIMKHFESQQNWIQLPPYEDDSDEENSSSNKKIRFLRLKQAWVIAEIGICLALCVFLLFETFRSDSWFLQQLLELINRDTTTPIKVRVVEKDQIHPSQKQLSNPQTPVAEEASPSPIDDGIKRPDLGKEEQAVAEQKIVKTLAPFDAKDGAVISFAGRSWVEIRDKNGRAIINSIKQSGENVALSPKGSPYRLNITRPELASIEIRGKKVPIESLRNSSNFREIIINLEH